MNWLIWEYMERVYDRKKSMERVYDRKKSMERVYDGKVSQWSEFIMGESVH